MAAEPHPTRPPTVEITATDAQRAQVSLAGDFDAGAVLKLEERLADPRLHETDEWVYMRDVARLDLPCAFALLRAATERPKNAALTIRGARHDVQQTLRHAGLEAVAVIGE